MAMFGAPRPNDYHDDITCGGCGSPLLNLKTVCPKCGGKAKQLSAVSANTPVAAKSASTESSSSLGVQDQLVGMGLLVIAVIGLLFAIINPLMGGVAPVDLFRSFMALAASVGLLGLRQLVLR